MKTTDTSFNETLHQLSHKSQDIAVLCFKEKSNAFYSIKCDKVISFKSN